MIIKKCSADSNELDEILTNCSDQMKMYRNMIHLIRNIQFSYKVKTVVFYKIEDNKLTSLLCCYYIKNINTLCSIRDINQVNTDNNIVRFAAEYCREAGIKNIFIYSNEYEKNIVGDINNTKNISLKLFKSIIDQWKDLPKKTRNMVRKGEKNGLKISYDKSNINEFYCIYVLSMLKKNVVPHTYRFMENMLKTTNNVELITTIFEGKVIAGLIVIRSGQYATYPFHASNSDFVDKKPNHLLIWEMITHCIKYNVNKIDLGEASDGSGVYKFKKSFGGHISDIYKISMDTAIISDMRNNDCCTDINSVSISKNIVYRSTYIGYIQRVFFLIREKMKYFKVDFFKIIILIPCRIITLVSFFLKRRRHLGI